MRVGGEDLNDSVMISPGVMERAIQAGRLSVFVELLRCHNAWPELVLDPGPVTRRASWGHDHALGGGGPV